MHSILKCLNVASQLRYYAKQAVGDMKFLNVAEKHDAAKTIAGLLSNGTANRREGYSVYNKVFDFEAPVRGRNAKMVMTSVSGHLMHLEFLVSYRNWRNVDPRSLFDAPTRKAVGEDYVAIKRTLEREIRGCQGLIIWTDCDREGENIGYEIIDVCRAIKPNLTIYRANFSEITTAAVRRALAQLGQPDKRQSDAVDVRTELDLRTGAAITRFQTLRLQRLFPEKIADKLISYGSCQIPTLGFVVERYKEVEAFVSEPFWKIRVLHTIEDLTVEFNWARNRLFDKEACENYLLLCLADPRATVENVTVKPKNKWRPAAMDTVEMEKLGSRKLKLSAKETMTIAEKLYTKGLISYPRTETNQFSKEFDLVPLVEQQTGHSVWGEFANRVLQWGPNPRNGNKSDQAHPPIHPTKLVTNLDGNEARVYELVVRHFLACVSKDAVGSETIVNIDIAGEKFNANGLVIYERNYLDVYVYEKWNAKQIHHYEQGQVFEPTEIALHEGQTTAPPLLTEADLIALMEKHGIGTDATHAEHINTIKERGYIGVVDKGSLVPGVIGMGLYEGYDAMELALAKPALRANFEADLKLICQGQKDPKLVLSEQIIKYKEAYQQITEKVAAMDAKIANRINETPTTTGPVDGSTNAEPSPIVQELYQCPKCSVANLALKPKKNQTGHMIGCLNFPDCKNVVWLPDECKEYSVLDECCQHCGAGYRLLKLKLTSAYYRTLFNAPHGWFKTCLRCDGQFRNTFNINVDSVKRVGGIVGEHAIPRATTVSRSNTGNTGGNQTSLPSSGTSSFPSRNTGNPPNPKTKKPPSSKGGSKTLEKRTTKATTKTNAVTEQRGAGGGIRNYFTASTAAPSTTIDDFFDNNDDFELEMVAAASMAESNPTANNILDDDLAAAFAAEDDADFEALLVNGNEGGQSPPPSPPGGAVYDNNGLPAMEDLNNSIASWVRRARETEEAKQPISWGTRGRGDESIVPAPKRVRLQESSSQNNAASRAVDVTVLCNGCHQPARRQTTVRDGPNKGRDFYKCPKPNACKFFQWADEAPSADVRLNTSSSSWPSAGSSQPQASNSNINANTTWGSSNASTSSSWGTRNVGSATVVRSNSSSTVTITHSSNDHDGVKCNCGKPARGLIVRKDNPNKGRPFYGCALSGNGCGFFQWADTDTNSASSSNATMRQATNSSDSGTTQTTRARKCGLCRQEGHTKNKCPRKSEFEY